MTIDPGLVLVCFGDVLKPKNLGVGRWRRRRWPCKGSNTCVGWVLAALTIDFSNFQRPGDAIPSTVKVR